MTERQVALARWIAVASAAVGVCVVITLAFAMGLQPLMQSARLILLIGIGATACVVAAGALGALSASSFATGSRTSAGFRGACIAVGALEIGSLAGGIASLLMALVDRARLGHPLTYILGPAFWVSLCGILPALVLGVAFGLIARRVLRKSLVLG